MLGQTEILIFLTYTLSVFISGMVGFGGFLVFFGLMAFAGVESKELLFLGTGAALVKCISSAWFFRNDIPWSVVKKVFLIALPLVFVGGMLTNALPAQTLRQLIGGFTLVYVTWRVFGRNKGTGQISRLETSVWAGTWGFLSGLIGAGGPILVALMNRLKLGKAAFVAALQTLFIGSLLIKAPLYYPIESAYSKNFTLLSMLCIAGITASYVGKHLNNKIPQKAFERTVLGLLFITGLKLVVG